MKVYAQFICPGYAMPFPDQYESFSSFKDAKEAFESRCNFDPYFPCVDPEFAKFYIYFGEPAAQDCYPDRILKIGPRGDLQCHKVG